MNLHLPWRRLLIYAYLGHLVLLGVAGVILILTGSLVNIAGGLFLVASGGWNINWALEQLHPSRPQ